MATPTPAVQHGALRGPESGRPLPWPQRGWFWLALAFGLAGLPTETFAPEWIGLFLVPGVVFHHLTARPFPGDTAARTTLSLTFVLALQLGILVLHTPTPGPEAALTYFLLAPLAFAGARARDVDVLLGLFLALCLLLIGAEFERTQRPLLIGGYLLAASLTLRLEVRHRNAPARAARRFGSLPRVRRHLGHLTIAAAALCAATGLHTLARSIPTVSKRRVQAAAPKRVGIDSTFELDGRRAPLELVSDELVTVTPMRPGGAVPRDLYLRATYFDIAAISSWGTAAPRGKRRLICYAEYWKSFPPTGPNRPEIALTIERHSADKGIVWMPPSTKFFRGDATLNWIPHADHALQLDATGPLAYSIRAWRRDSPASGERALTDNPQLLQLPRDLPRRYDQLAEEWAGSEVGAVRIARALVNGLQSRCRYVLADPTGRMEHALDNFLFGEENTGYCMHFASALAILLRCRGVPSRIGVGLYGGAKDELDDVARTFGSQHAHAWVEVPLENRGFVVFDATPPAYLQSSAARFPDRSQPGGTEDDEGPAERAHRQRSWLDTATLGRWVWRVVPWIALAGLLLSSRFWPRRREQREQDTATAPLPEALVARRALGQVLRNLSKAGQPRRAGETLEAFGARLRARAYDADPDGERKPAPWLEVLPSVDRAFESYQEIRFGHYPLDAIRLRAITNAQAATKSLR